MTINNIVNLIVYGVIRIFINLRCQSDELALASIYIKATPMK